MKLALTARPLRSDLKAACKRLWRRALEDIGVSSASVADQLDVAHGIAERWAHEDTDHPLPVYALASRRAVPESLYQRVLADLDALRAQQGDGLHSTVEGAAAMLVARAGATLDEIGRALADGRVTSVERPGMRRVVAALRSQCDSLLRLLGEDEERRRGVQ